MEHSFTDAFVTALKPEHQPHPKNKLFRPRKSQQNLDEKLKTEETLHLENKILEYLRDIPQNSCTMKAIENLGLNPNILNIDLKQLYKVVCTNPFGKYQYQKLLTQKASKLNSVAKEIGKINRMRNLLEQKKTSSKELSSRRQTEQSRQKETGLSKTLKCLKSYYKRALIEEINFRKKNIRILNEKGIAHDEKENPPKGFRSSISKPKTTTNIDRKSTTMGQTVATLPKQKKRLESVPDLSKHQESRSRKRQDFNEMVRRNKQSLEQEYQKYIESLKQHHNRTLPSKTQAAPKKVYSSVDQHIRVAHQKKEKIEERTFVTHLHNLLGKERDIVNARRANLQLLRKKMHHGQNKLLRSVSNNHSPEPKQVNNEGFREDQNNDAVQKKNIYLKTISEGIRAKNEAKFEAVSENLKQNRELLNTRIEQIKSKQLEHEAAKTKEKNTKNRLIFENFKLRGKRDRLDEEISKFRNLSDDYLSSQLCNIDEAFLKLIH